MSRRARHRIPAHIVVFSRRFKSGIYICLVHAIHRASTVRAIGCEAFTLVEMLAAVAITALLAALLMLGVQSAADKSKSARCLSNLKQLGVAIHAYAADNNGQMAATTDLPSPAVRWVTLIKPYLGEQIGRKSVFLCPAEEKQPVDDERGTPWHYIRTDAMVHTGDVPAFPTGPRGLARRLVTLQKPSETLLLVDGVVWRPGQLATDSNLGWNVAKLDVQKGDNEEPDHLSFRHNGIMNVLFVDGHVGSIAWKDRAFITEARWRGYGF
jgi:prepilin-type processing-associated H-X9-DG protein/prepilin-type N-terminal cleavage/methylation domain-containing protein